MDKKSKNISAKELAEKIIALQNKRKYTEIKIESLKAELDKLDNDMDTLLTDVVVCV